MSLAVGHPVLPDDSLRPTIDHDDTLAPVVRDEDVPGVRQLTDGRPSAFRRRVTPQLPAGATWARLFMA
jgi:hypothetical protein